MSERSSTTSESSPATRPLDRRGRLAPVSLALALIALALHVAFDAKSPLINSAFRHSIRNWILAGPHALPGILLSLLAVPFLKLFPRLRDKWASPIAIALWFGLIIRLATYAIPEQNVSSTYSPAQKAAVGPQSESVSRDGSYADRLYRSLSPRFRLNIPDGWNIKKPKGPNIRLLLVSETGESITITCDIDPNLRSTTSHDLDGELFLVPMRQYTDVRLLGRRNTYVNMMKAQILEYEWIFRNLDRETTFVSALTLITHRDKLFQVTFTSERERWQINQNVLKTFLGTFVIEEDF